jgi:hypothetical protein
MSETGLNGTDVAISIFDKHAREIMVIPVIINGQMTQMDLLRELMFDDRDLADYSALFARMKKLPPLLTFFGIMKDRAAAAAAEIEDDFRFWFAQESEKAKKKLNEDQANFKASLMKAPTIADIEGWVMTNNQVLWREWRDKKTKAQDRVSVLSRLLEGLQSSVKLVGSESSLLQALISRGIEAVTNPSSRYSGANHPSNHKA